MRVSDSRRAWAASRAARSGGSAAGAAPPAVARALAPVESSNNTKAPASLEEAWRGAVGTTSIVVSRGLLRGGRLGHRDVGAGRRGGRLLPGAVGASDGALVGAGLGQRGVGLDLLLHRHEHPHR